MKLLLSPETKQRIDAILETGRYDSADDLVVASLAALEQQEQFGDFAPGELDPLLAEGERSLKNETPIDAAAVFAELRQRGERRTKSSVRRGKSA